VVAESAPALGDAGPQQGTMAALDASAFGGARLQHEQTTAAGDFRTLGDAGLQYEEKERRAAARDLDMFEDHRRVSPRDT
jgi:hypothetical protein